MPERTLAALVGVWLDAAWVVQPLHDADHATVYVPRQATAAQIAWLVAEVQAHGCYYDHPGRQWRLPEPGEAVIVTRGPAPAAPPTNGGSHA